MAVVLEGTLSERKNDCTTQETCIRTRCYATHRKKRTKDRRQGSESWRSGSRAGTHQKLRPQLSRAGVQGSTTSDASKRVSPLVT